VQDCFAAIMTAEDQKTPIRFGKIILSPHAEGVLNLPDKIRFKNVVRLTSKNQPKGFVE
jgi:hypothetical protein